MGSGVAAKAVAIVLVVLAVGACAGGPISVAPSPEPHYQVGQAYRYMLYSHCGVKEIVLNDSVWVADPPQTNSSGSGPPYGWSMEDDSGTLTLISRDHASFKAKSGRVIDFYLAPGLKPTPNRCI